MNLEMDYSDRWTRFDSWAFAVYIVLFVSLFVIGPYV